MSVLSRHLPRIVYLSAQVAPDRPDSVWARVERAVESSAESWMVIRPTGFASNTLMWAPQTRAGDVVRWAYGNASRSPVDERDVAAVAVRTLTEAKHNGARYVLTGPETLTQIEQLEAIGRALGRDLRWEMRATDLRPPGRHARRRRRRGRMARTVGVVCGAPGTGYPHGPRRDRHPGASIRRVGGRSRTGVPVTLPPRSAAARCNHAACWRPFADGEE
jgi:hypothetical protein